MKIKEAGQGLCEYAIGNTILAIIAALLSGQIDIHSLSQFIRDVLAICGITP